MPRAPDALKLTRVNRQARQSSLPYPNASPLLYRAEHIARDRQQWCHSRCQCEWRVLQRRNLLQSRSASWCSADWCSTPLSRRITSTRQQNGSGRAPAGPNAPACYPQKEPKRVPTCTRGFLRLCECLRVCLLRGVPACVPAMCTCACSACARAHPLPRKAGPGLMSQRAAASLAQAEPHAHAVPTCAAPKAVACCCRAAFASQRRRQQMRDASRIPEM